MKTPPDLSACLTSSRFAASLFQIRTCHLLLAVACINLSAFARDPESPKSWRLNSKPLAEISQHMAPAINPADELKADKQKSEFWPLRYAASSDVKITPYTHGTWENVTGGRLWRLRIHSKGATDLNFGFTGYWLPDGATLHVMAENEPYFQGPYTAADNKSHGELWTPVTPGSAAVIELFVPETARKNPVLVLTRINRGYRDLFERSNDPAAKDAKSGSCNIMVACPIADNWRDEIRSVATYSFGGSRLCTGTLVMNTARDYKSYFLTADHCGIGPANAASVVVYWNFNSSGCNTQTGGSLAQNQSGAFFRASRTDVDMALIELDDMPKPAFNVYYAGWDRSGTTPPGAVGIHHPNTDTKAISFSDSALTTIDNCIGDGFSTHWNVNWSTGVTEPGSSGSAIWNSANHKVVGFLSGGDSACGGSNQSDCYGKFSVAWDSGTTAASRLKDWLDPLNTGEEIIDGANMVLKPLLIGAGSTLSAENRLPRNSAIDPGETVTVQLSLKNIGNFRATNVTAILLATNGVTLSRTNAYGLLTAGGLKVTRPFTFTASGACGDIIKPTLELRSGGAFLGRVEFLFRLGRLNTSVMENFDGVVVPGLPSGWSTLENGYGTGWKTTRIRRFSGLQSVFASGYAYDSDSYLYAPPAVINDKAAQMSFRHFYNLESRYDGGTLEIAIDGGAFVDIVEAGGSFVQGGYNKVMYDDSPFAGAQAWSGSTSGFVLTVVNLPSAALSKEVQFRWRMVTDYSTRSGGWFIDNYTLLNQFSCYP